MELGTLDAASLTASISRGDVSAGDVTRAVLDGIHRRDHEVRAWAHVDDARATDAAERVDRDAHARSLAPLAGVPVGVKDLIDTADLPTEYGSERYRGNRPDVDAACVTSLGRAGAIVVGKTVTTELALWSRPPTRNPRARSRTPGGSSAGSAAAVADCMVPVAVGTQTAGSVIRPASYCGVVGFVPSAGRWDTAGLKPLSPSLDRVGVFARTTDDLHAVGRALDGRRPPFRASDGRERRLRLGVTQDVDEAAPELCGLVERIGGIRRFDVWRLLGVGAELHDTVMRRELRMTLRSEIDDPHGLDVATRSFLESLESEEGEHDAARLATGIASCRAEVEAMFLECDVLVASSVASEAPPAEEGTGDPWFCRLWSLLGLPSLSLPVCEGPTGLPVGLQIVGRLGDDDTVIDVAQLIDQEIRSNGVLEWLR